MESPIVGGKGERERETAHLVDQSYFLCLDSVDALGREEVATCLTDEDAIVILSLEEKMGEDGGRVSKGQGTT